MDLNDNVVQNIVDNSKQLIIPYFYKSFNGDYLLTHDGVVSDIPLLEYNKYYSKRNLFYVHYIYYVF